MFQKCFLLYISILLYFPALRLLLWQHSNLFAYGFILCFIKHTAKSMFCDYYSTFCTVVNRIRSTNQPTTQLKIPSIFPHQLPVQTSVHVVHLPAFQCPAHMYPSYEGSLIHCCDQISIFVCNGIIPLHNTSLDMPSVKISIITVKP